jgi:uncharacterized membrane protein YfcA
MGHLPGAQLWTLWKKGSQEERTRVKRWLILLFVAILIGLIGFAGHHNSLEALGLVVAVIAIALGIWSAVKLSLQVRPPTMTKRRRFKRVHMPSIRRRGRPGAFTEELHAAIFQDQTVE